MPTQEKNIIDITLEFLEDDIYKYIIAIPEIEQPFLFHYTTSNGLIQIFESNCMWCSNTNYLNDTSELSYAFGIIEDILQRFNEDCENNTFKAVLGNIPHLHNSIDSYVLCLTEDSDLLSQWLAYGEKGSGYSIGFRSNDIFTFKEKPSNEFYAAVRKVEYNRQNQEKIIFDTLERAYLHFQKVLKSGMKFEESELILRFSQALSWYFADIMLWFKHPAFREEKEWRIIHLIDPETQDCSIINFRPGFNKIIPYIKLKNFSELENDRLPVTTITAGPMLDKTLAIKSLNLLTKKYNREDAQLDVSDIPLCL